jgi:hypothetical protein
MADVLADLSVEALAAWYARVADKTMERKWGGTELIASQCLRLWLENRTPYETITIEAPLSLRSSPYVNKELNFHRKVYLTEEKARLSSGEKWAGIVPRLQGKGHSKQTRLKGIHMEYESLVRVPITAPIFGSSEDKDLLYALHGLQLRTEVTVSCARVAGSSQIQVVFVSFQAKMKNRYEWNPEHQIRVPNPDFKSRSKSAVAPDSEIVMVDNAHAVRLEEAGLAAPYYLESESWFVDTDLRAPGQVDLEKKI